MMKFNQKYNQDVFGEFLREFLPEDYTEKEKDIAQVERCKIINKVRELGYSKSLDLYVLEMNHAKETDPRVSIATDAFRILANYGMDKALVIFKNDDSDNYRFSYLTITLELNEKSKVVKQYSNARRYSFFLGENAKIRTPEQQLIKKGRIKDAEDLLSRFSVEVVNKQFYLEIAKFFDELVSSEDKNLTLPGVSEEDTNTRKSFAVRLIGRIMFCWFLKQKKSDNGQLIPDELLSSKIVSDNYYHNTLEPLFFGVLNTSIDSRDIRSDSFDKVPYLNGGLFNPQSDDYYELDRGTFTSRHINTLKINDSWFKDFFELLETYNFTIDENTVFDQELSVDPEMLGRIFENLLAEINPETGSSERKRTGSFYTPRQIVEYMVDQSLIEYLKTKTKIDEKKLSALISYDLTDDTEHPLTDKDKQEIVNSIESLRILDPACGSGAYPIGALQKIVYILQQIDPDCKLWLEQKLKNVPELYKKKIIDEVKSNPFDYTRKLDVIKNSIFGVDIQPIAVDVSRLRCFLTLVVESEINDSKQNRGIEPLPNLDFKFVCANTLIGLPKLETNSLFEDHSGIKELSEIMSEYFTANRSEKESIKTRFFNKQKDLLNHMIEIKTTGNLTLKLTLWNPFSNTSNSWFDPEWMFGLEERFDVVIGNPPYGAKLDKEIKKDFIYSANGKIESYRIFIEKALQMDKKSGVVTFIVPNTWMYIEQALPLRQHLLKNTEIKVLATLPQSTFTASVDSMVFLLKNNLPQDNKSLVFEIPLKNSLSTIDLHLKDGKLFNQDEWLNSDKSIIAIGQDNALYKVIAKLKNKSQKFSDFVYIKQGLIPYLTKEDGKENKYISKNREGEDWGKYFDGSRCIDRYSTKGVISYIKYGDWLYAPREQDIFRKPRIIYQLIRNISLKRRIVATYLDEEIYSDRNTGLIFTKPGVKVELKYILGILNSKLINFIHSKSHNSTYVSFPSIESLPFVLGDESFQQKIISLVNEILEIKTKNRKSDVDSFESQIDELVMDLYGLSEEERKIIENSSKK